MERVYIGLGSNVGDRQGYLQSALGHLGRIEGVSMLRTSSVMKTRPVGVEDQPDFLNMVAECDVDLAPHELLLRLQSIERDMGRTRERRWGPRTIDLDILLYSSRCMKTANLEIPHPRLHEREFALRPLAELIPDFVHPVLHKTIRQLLDAVSPVPAL